MSPPPDGPRRVLIVDDSPLQCKIWAHLLKQRYDGRVAIETYSDPLAAVDVLGPDIHLMLLDWEMPNLDGEAVLEMARVKGVDLKRVIITSGHPADELHQVFDCSGCLAVIEKTDSEQREAFLMILDSIMKR